MGIRTVMLTGDNPLTAGQRSSRPKPNPRSALIRDYQAKGHLVAMTGDEMNDAPALAQADVAVAMNTGTRPPRGGTRLDLDRMKPLDVVEIGKQMRSPAARS